MCCELGELGKLKIYLSIFLSFYLCSFVSAVGERVSE